MHIKENIYFSVGFVVFWFFFKEKEKKERKAVLFYLLSYISIDTKGTLEALSGIKLYDSLISLM